MKITKNKYYSLTSGAFESNYLNSLSEKILSCRYLGSSQLSDSFTGTKGFSVIFKISKISQVKRNFPYFIPYLKYALKPNCNAFYLNPLILEKGGCVEPHVDCSISGYSKSLTIAHIVSVLYVRVPSNLEGGELILTKKGDRVGEIKPKINTLLHFDGNLTHSVNEVKSQVIRISLVCEQYTLSETKLKQIPDFEIISSNVVKSY
jgi:Rps23 Pro-64 3,4-dihydroxylase Tpa1-like proline 4-hydroxylase